MPAPSLKIPVSVDLAAFKQQMNQVSNGVGDAVKIAGQAFKNVNGEILGIAKDTASGAALAWGQSAASIALRLTLMATAGIQVFKLLGAAVNQAREDLVEMVKVADGARDTGTGTDFFQKFIAESKNLKVPADELKSALETAFNATKVELNEGWLQGDETKTKVNDIAKAVKELSFELFTVSKPSLGAQIFKDAQSQEERIRGALVLMTELEKMGEKAASLNVAEKMFGAQAADRMRQGRLSADGMLESINRAAGESQGVFPSELVQRAKEIDDQLKIASNRLAEDMKPSFEAIERVVLDIKSAWVSIVDLTAKAVEAIGKIRPATSPNSGAPAIVNDQITSLETRLRNGGLTSTQRSGMEQQLSDLRSKAAQAGFKSGAYDLVPPYAPPSSGGGVPLPKGRPSDAPKADAGGAGSPDAFDRQTDSINRHIAALNADAAAVDQTTAAQEQMRAEAQLLQALQRDDAEVTQKQVDAYTVLRGSMSAQQALAAAGITLNQEHAQTFADLSQRIGDAAGRADSMKRSFAGVNDALNFGGNEAISIMDGLRNKTLSASDAARQLGNSLIHALEQALLLGQGPLAGVLGFASPTAGTGGLIGALFKGLSFASGGYTGAGGRNQPAGVVHRGEYVFDQGSVNRIGLANLMSLHRGYADGGLVVAPGAEGGSEMIDTRWRPQP